MGYVYKLTATRDVGSNVGQNKKIPKLLKKIKRLLVVVEVLLVTPRNDMKKKLAKRQSPHSMQTIKTYLK